MRTSFADESFRARESNLSLKCGICALFLLSSYSFFSLKKRKKRKKPSPSAILIKAIHVKSTLNKPTLIEATRAPLIHQRKLFMITRFSQSQTHAEEKPSLKITRQSFVPFTPRCKREPCELKGKSEAIVTYGSGRVCRQSNTIQSLIHPWVIQPS
jgi:hypothetical protein